LTSGRSSSVVEVWRVKRQDPDVQADGNNEDWGFQEINQVWQLK